MGGMNALIERRAECNFNSLFDTLQQLNVDALMTQDSIQASMHVNTSVVERDWQIGCENQ